MTNYERLRGEKIYDMWEDAGHPELTVEPAGNDDVEVSFWTPKYEFCTVLTPGESHGFFKTFTDRTGHEVCYG